MVRFQREPKQKALSYNNDLHSGNGRLPNATYSGNIIGNVYWIRAKELDAWVLNFISDSDISSSEGGFYDSDEEIKFEDKDFENVKGDSDVEKVLEISDNIHQTKESDPTHPPGFTPELGNNNKEEGSSSINDQRKSVSGKKILSYHIVEASTHHTTCMPIIGGSIMIDRWDGETVVLGDFNEVQMEQERLDLNDITSNEALDLSQKAKIRWSIEGDEYSKYFHEILNSKRSQLAIRGILHDGDWIVKPTKIYDAKIIKDFRPISLIGSIYKIIAKILTNWKRILKKQTKTKPKNDKTKHKVEKIGKDKVIRSRKSIKSQSPRSTKVNPGKVKVNPDKPEAEK
nr:RNA-directed DNA polymerase, eukaryota [Tanacetum cinerariifolium]